MTVIGDYETIIPAILIFPRFDIDGRNLVRIPEISIHAVIDHLYLPIRDPVDQPDGIHGIIGYAVIHVIGEPENHFFE